MVPVKLKEYTTPLYGTVHWNIYIYIYINTFKNELTTHMINKLFEIHMLHAV